MSVRVFVDTNVFVYARDSADKAKQLRAAAWIRRLGRTEGRTSMQVLNEYYVTVTRKLDPGLRPDDARSDVRNLLLWRPVAVDRAVVEQAWTMEDRFSISFWDALVVAAAKLQSCTHLLSEDLQAGQDLDGVVVVDPFDTDPSALG